MIKKSIAKVLRKALKVKVVKVSSNPKEDVASLSKPFSLRLIYFYEHLRNLASVKGEIVECGVGWGRSIYAFCVCQSFMKQKRMIYGFDSFEGFPEPTSEDNPEKTGVKKGRYKTGQDSVIRFLVNSGIPKDFINSNVKFVPGFFSESMSKYDGGDIAFLHLDVDLYSSYKETLEFFYPKVATGGIIAFDEYQTEKKYPGAKKAVDEFFSGRKEKIVRSEIMDRYYTVKV